MPENDDLVRIGTDGHLSEDMRRRTR